MWHSDTLYDHVWATKIAGLDTKKKKKITNSARFLTND